MVKYQFLSYNHLKIKIVMCSGSILYRWPAAIPHCPIQYCSHELFFLPAFRIYLLHVQSLKVPITAAGIQSSLYRPYPLRPVRVHSGTGTRATVSFVSGVFYRVAYNKVSTCKKPPRCSAI